MVSIARRPRSGHVFAAGGPLVSAVSVQSGAGFGATLLPLVGAVGVVGLRQLFAALVLSPILVRVARTLTWRSARLAILLGLVLVAMNAAIYASFERIDLGLAVTLEFLGPLTVALLSSRRILDLLCALAAGGGVILLTGTVAGIDFLGVLFALVAGAAWAGYVVVGHRLSGQLSGLAGTAIASAVASACTLPFLIGALLHLPPEHLPLVLGVGVAVGVLSSALPYSLDIAVMKRIPRGLFSVLQSVHPAAAAVAGWLILGQTLASAQLMGLAAISLANAVAVLGSARRDAVARRAERALIS